VLCNIAQIRDSSLCYIARSKKKVFCDTAPCNSIFLSTTHYATLRGVDSSICYIAPSRNSALFSTAGSHLYLRISLRIRSHMQK
jgi:hypothetical protein